MSIATLEISKPVVENGVVLLRVRGCLDSQTFRALQTVFDGLQRAGQTRIVLDLGGLDYISSCGAGVIIQAFTAAEERGGLLVLADLRAQVQSTFDVLGLAQLFPCARDVAEARAMVEEFGRAGAAR